MFCHADIVKAKELVSSGAHLKDAASAIGMTPDALSKRLRLIGFAVPRRGAAGRPGLFNAAQESELVSRYTKGESCLSLAQAFGTTRAPIAKVLKRHGVALRGGSGANTNRLNSMSAEQLQELTAKARTTRMQNLQHNARQGITSHAIGYGECELLEALRGVGVPALSQQPIGPYLVDLAYRRTAIEVKIKARVKLGRIDRPERIKHILERGWRLVYVASSSLTDLMQCLDEVVAALQVLHSNPATLGKHWVVWCGRDLYAPVKSHKGKGACIGRSPTVQVSVTQIDLY